MALKEEDLTVKVKVDTGSSSEALKDVEAQLKKLQATSDKTQDGLAGFVETFTKVNLGIFAFMQNLKLGISAAEDFFKGFIEGEDAMTRFGFAMDEVGGKNAAAMTKSVISLSKEIQRLGIAEDDQVQSLSAVAAAAGASAQQINDIAKAAAGISVIKPNVSFAEAFNALQKSLKGTVGPLSLLAPELKNMTDSSAKAGDAVAYLVSKYGSYAQKNLDTYTGKLRAANSAFDEAKDEVAQTIAEFINLPGILTKSADAFRAVTKGVQDMNEGFKDPAVKIFIGSMAAATAAVGAYVIAQDSMALTILAANFKLAAQGAFALSRNLLAFAGVAAGVVTVGVGVQTLIDNFKQLSDIVTGLAKAGMDALILGINRTIAAGIQLVDKVLTPLGKLPVISDILAANRKNLESLDAAAKKAGESLDKNLGQAREGFASIDTSAIQKVEDFASKIVGMTTDVAKASGEYSKRVKEIVTYSDDAMKAIDEIKGKLKEAEKAAASAGLEGVAKITAEAMNAQSEISKLGDTIRKGTSNGIIPPKVLADLNKLRELTKRAFDAQAVEAFGKAADDLQKETLAVQQALSNVADLTLDKIDKQMQAQLKIIQLKREELDRQQLLNGEMEDYLQSQEAAVKAIAKEQSKKAPGREFEQVTKAGEDITSSITGAFQSGTVGMVTGALGVVDAMADVFQKIIDFIPGLINKVSRIFESLTNFPETLLNAFKGLGKTLTGFIKNFFSNVVDFFGDFGDLAQNFLDGIPDALQEGITKFIDSISSLFEKLPDMFQKSLEGMFGDGGTKFMDALIKGIPRMIGAFFKMIPRLVSAFVNGMVNGIKNLFKSFSNFFSGKMPKLQIDEKSGQNLIKNLTGNSNNLFKVEDIGKKAGDYIGDLMNKIGDGFRKGRDYLKEAWNWINEKIIQPIWGLITRAWTWVNDNVIQPIWGVIVGAWNWVNEKIIQPIWSLIVGAWNWVNEKIIQPIWGVIVGAWDWIRQKIIQPILDGFTSVFNWVGGIFQPIIQGFRDAWGWIKDIFDKVIDFFKNFSLGSITGGGGGGGTLGQITGGITKALGGLKFAQGGLVPQYRAAGDLIDWTPKGSDTVPAMLTPGEFIMSRRGVQNVGLDNLRSMNAGNGGGGSTTINVTVNLESNGTLDATYVRDKLVPAMRDAFKKASQNGDFVIDKRGIR